ncbi:hypothetical protein X975_16573, partial [Stegodyphus mimosarum]
MNIFLLSLTYICYHLKYLGSTDLPFAMQVLLHIALKSFLCMMFRGL